MTTTTTACQNCTRHVYKCLVSDVVLNHTNKSLRTGLSHFTRPDKRINFDISRSTFRHRKIAIVQQFILKAAIALPQIC